MCIDKRVSARYLSIKEGRLEQGHILVFWSHKNFMSTVTPYQTSWSATASILGLICGKFTYVPIVVVFAGYLNLKGKYNVLFNNRHAPYAGYFIPYIGEVCHQAPF